MDSSKLLSVKEISQDELVLCVRGLWAWILILFLSLLGFLLLIYLLYKLIQGPNYCKKNRINGQVVIITGCNTGIGKETALELARRGGRIYMACRDTQRCEAARLEIIEQTGNENVFNRLLDLGSLESVRQFVESFLKEETKLGILVNNAGVLGTPHTLTIDGYEQTFAINHLGHFLLTNLLLDRLKASAPSRIVVVSSTVYAFGSIKKDDLNSFRSYSKFSAYSQSKLANVLFTLKLAKILEGTGVTVNCLHPGIVRTEISRNVNVSLFCRNSMDFLSKFLMKSPRAGAQTTLRLALDPSLSKSSGGYYSDCFPFPLVPWVGNANIIDWLWDKSSEMVGLKNAI